MRTVAVDFEDTYQLKTYKKWPIQIERAEDVWVYTSDGERYLDLYGGHAVVVTGHCHPRIVAALQRQAELLIFYSNQVYSEVRAQAAQKLIEIAPDGLARVFFVNSGAEANENALKLARKLTGKPGILSFEGGFHGRTLGTLSATGISQYRDAFEVRVPFHYFAPFGDLQATAELMNPEIAGVLLEPIQSMAGVRLAPAEFYQGLRRLCDEHGALLIYDEVQTGFGRTGEFFFTPSYGVTPDMITLAKGIASGVPMGVLLVSGSIAEQVHFGDLGTTFGGGPLACVALRATIEVIQEQGLLSNVQTQSRYLREQLLSLKGVQAVPGLGFLIGIKFNHEASVYQKRLLQQKILTGLSNDPHVVRLLPPLTLQQPEIDHFLDILSKIDQELA
jgi:acetylornithine aminotransferase/acetylornithine/N-succinyldiaminopimelate aminotransferase